MRIKTILLALLLAANFAVFSQVPSIEWEKCLGGSYSENATSIQQTTDGGYIVAGNSDSNDGDVTGNHLWPYGFTNDYWVVRLDVAGNLIWEKSLGGSSYEYTWSVQQTSDGGFIVAGVSTSNDGDVSGNHPSLYGGNSEDYWIVKLDPSGNLVWEKSLGGSGNDWANSVKQTTDGGFIVAGYTSSNDGDVSGNHGGLDSWIVKLDSAGNLLWQKCLGGSEGEFAYCVRQTNDGGFIVAGGSASNDGDVTGNHLTVDSFYYYYYYYTDTVTTTDLWIVKLDSSGDLVWQKSLGGSSDDHAFSIDQTIDGGYIVSGESFSNDGDVSGNHGDDYWIIRLDTVGNIIWQKCLGGSGGGEYARSVQQTTDGGFVVAGSSHSTDGDVTGNHGEDDYWIVKLDSGGNLVWQKPVGGSRSDVGFSIQQTVDGGFIAAGGSDSNDDDVSGLHDSMGFYSDFWIVKLTSDLGTETHSILNNSISVYPNPSTGIFQIQNLSPSIQTAEAFNLPGEKVFSSSNFISQISNSIDLSSQPDGVYFLHLKTTEGILVKKVVISR